MNMTFKKVCLVLSAMGSLAMANGTHAEGTDPQWTYINQAGWGAQTSLNAAAPVPELYPYAECGIGKKQSPIDILSSNAVKNGNINGIRFSYATTPLSVTNNGHVIKVNMPASKNNKNAFFIGKQKYELVQFEFHAPSEHKIDGQFSKMEIQFRHTTASGKQAIIGVLVTENYQGKDNSTLQKILDNAYGQIDIPITPSNTTINPSKLLPDNKTFYTYAGSLTAPPCTEGIDWYVLRNPLKVSAAQITAFQNLYFGNVRTGQALNGRKVDKNFN
ncbi:MAG: carbonic anhydrase family protein [Methylococcales bacterium]|nr:carbonic anhydrase family protein [Methylococcales bacterium]